MMNQQPPSNEWLSTPEGKHYAARVHGQLTAIVDFKKTSAEVDNVQKIIAYTSLADANSICSMVQHDPMLEVGVHKPALDIDVPALLIPSTTPGHSHLYLDVPMSWRKYHDLLKALAAAGIIEPGFMHASINREASWLRTPWTRK